MNVALVQMYCKWGDTDYNLKRISYYCHKAKSAGIELIVFPELAVTGIYKDPRLWDLAESIDGPSVHFLQELARQHDLAIGAGFTEKAEGKPYNAYCVMGPSGEIAGIYRKNYIPKLEVPFWQGHSSRPVFKALRWRMGVSI